MKIKETIDKAYSNVPREPIPFYSVFDWLPQWRGIKYYFLKALRKITR